MGQAPGTRSDTSVMREVSDGDIRQLGVLFDRHHRQLFAFFVRMTGSTAASEDLVQEVFLRILKYRKTFRPENQFSSWLYQIARNARNDHSRKHRTEYLFDELQTESSALATRASDPHQCEESKTLHRALADLPPEKREILLLARFHGLTHKEIGEVVGCSADAAKLRVFRAMKELRQAYLKLTGEQVLWNAPR
jgi:RNA polymerase sigma factor (sigma-70 family)